MTASRDRGGFAAGRFRLSVAILLTAVCALAWSRGTPEETWQEVSGTEVWRQEIDISELKPGTHNLIIRARDFAGNEAFEGPYNIRIDPAVGLPSVRIVYPDRGAVLREDITVIGVASGSAGIGRVELRLGEGPALNAEGTEYWSRTIAAANLPDGAYSLSARAVDRRGTEGAAVSVPFVLDRSPPVVELTSHPSGALVSGTITIGGYADDANGVASVALSTDGGTSFEALRLRAHRGLPARGHPAVEFAFPVQTRKLPDGATIYQLRATDSTGAVTIQPVLFFVDNEPPQLEILTPQEEQTVFGTVRFTGLAGDTVGLARLFYEHNRQEHDIQLRPGDPYWTADIDLPGESARAVSVRFTAVDRSGNRTSVTRKLHNDPAAMLLSVSLSYPEPESLSALAPDGALYGSVTGGGQPEAVVVEGTAAGEYPARPGFRIPASDIAPGRGDLRIRARAADGTLGPPLRVRVARLVDAEGEPTPQASPVTVTGLQPYQHVRDSFALAGTVAGAGAGTRLEYRLSPVEAWRTIPAADGVFESDIRVASQPEGPLHLELRTADSAGANTPVYLPLNHSPGLPTIRVDSPRSGDVINGRVTVSGTVTSSAPVTEIAYSLDGEEYRPLEVVPAGSGSLFAFVADFRALQESGGRLRLRATDSAGGVSTVEPVVRVDQARDLPTVQLQLPPDGAVITTDFAVSGMAFDDDGVAAVYWRLGEGEYQRIEAAQSFRVDVPLAGVHSGEQTVEVYAEDIYGLAGPPVRVTVQVSTDRPVVEVLEPGLDDYCRGTVTIRGTASDLNGIAEVRLSMDNGNSFQIAEGTDAWSLALNTALYNDGSYSVLVVATDTLGVESRSTALLSIDNTAPALSLAEPQDGRLCEAQLHISGRVEDNILVQSLTLELSAVSENKSTLTSELRPGAVVLETIDVSELPPGWYNLRLVATDPAGNRSVVARNIEVAAGASAYEAVLYSPLPGATHTGPLTVSGRVGGPELPERVRVFSGETLLAAVDVDRFGFFHHRLADNLVLTEQRLDLLARYETRAGESVQSPVHAVHLRPHGPALTIESHRSGETITDRPWLGGRAWVELPPAEAQSSDTRRDRAARGVKRVLVSLDNGRSFVPAKGGEQWQFRLETGELARGPLSVLVRAEFPDGDSATARTLLLVDTAAPSVSLIAPEEGSRQADSLLVYGTAADDQGIESIAVNLRPGDKAGYSVPKFVQGLYLDTHVFGATYADVGLGVSFFEDNVKLQVQAGVAPPGRFTGTVIGAKLLANVLTLPFEHFFGPDWSFFSMTFALGANFSYFTMEPGADGLVMSAVLAQWEYARFRVPDWKAFHTFSLYLEPNLWFASSDVEAGAVFRMSLGLRAGIL